VSSKGAYAVCLQDVSYITVRAIAVVWNGLAPRHGGIFADLSAAIEYWKLHFCHVNGGARLQNRAASIPQKLRSGLRRPLRDASIVRDARSLPLHTTYICI